MVFIMDPKVRIAHVYKFKYNRYKVSTTVHNCINTNQVPTLATDKNMDIADRNNSFIVIDNGL